MVAAAHPLAAEVGRDILRRGGNAVDAAVATAFALGVVEPDASGIGGGGFLVFYDPEADRVRTVDCRERAPSGLQPAAYMEEGRPRQRALQYGGLSVGVPGFAHGLLTLHRLFGEMPVEALLDPAIDLASSGFPISEKFRHLLAEKAELLRMDDTAADIFLVSGREVPPAGHCLVQPAQAETLRAIRRLGLEAVYGEAPAERIASAVRAAGGVMSVPDIRGYKPVFRDPVQGAYRGYEIHLMGPPSRGGVVVLQALRILEAYDIQALGPEDPLFLALLVEALEEAYTGAAAAIADPGATDIDLAFLLSQAWADAARDRMRAPAGLSGAAPGPVPDPPVRSRTVRPVPANDGPGNTTHLSVMDGRGQLVAMTLTLNYHFGAGIAVPGMGFLLNNELDDFTLDPEHINRPAPGKIPRSNMAPMLIFRDGEPVGTLGTPGGGRIPAALVQILIRKIDRGEGLDDAIEAPRLAVDPAGRRIVYESRLSEERLREAVALLRDDRPYLLERRPPFDRYFGGAQGIWRQADDRGAVRVEGGADSRRDGVALGL